MPNARGKQSIFGSKILTSVNSKKKKISMTEPERQLSRKKE